MNATSSFTTCMKQILSQIVKQSELHAKWINTLSFLENCGARKIAKCEHPTMVKEEILKHASEEFRHAHYLKKQIMKISAALETYQLNMMLGGVSTLHYLTGLDIQTSRYLKNQGLHGDALKEASYLLVTYAIELRADQLYPLYEEILREMGSKVTVKSILLEEKGHLEEMIEGLGKMPKGFAHAEVVCGFEEALCKRWLQDVVRDLKL